MIRELSPTVIALTPACNPPPACWPSPHGVSGWRFALYHSCLYCADDLGHNDLLEVAAGRPPSGVRCGKGRLWVICTSVRQVEPGAVRLPPGNDRRMRAHLPRHPHPLLHRQHRPRQAPRGTRADPDRPGVASGIRGVALRARRCAGDAEAETELGADTLGAINWLLTALSGRPARVAAAARGHRRCGAGAASASACCATRGPISWCRCRTSR